MTRWLSLARGPRRSSAGRSHSQPLMAVATQRVMAMPDSGEGPKSAKSSSVLADMMKSFRWSPSILWVHQVTVTLPHSVKRAGW